jgi:hypothetical protein
MTLSNLNDLFYTAVAVTFGAYQLKDPELSSGCGESSKSFPLLAS